MPTICQPPDPNPRPPRIQCPPGATDCHLHILGPKDKYPELRDARYTAPDALPAACRHLHDILGIQRVVLVQPNPYGLDNRRQLDALAELGKPARAVVIVSPDTSDSELKRLHEAGVRGVRFVIGSPRAPSIAEIERFAHRLKPMGWHIQIQVLPEDRSNPLVVLESLLANLATDVVIDHMATVHVDDGIEQPNFQVVRRLMRGGRCWVKLSAAFRMSAEPPPYRDLIPFVQSLVETRSDRLVWGSDWPHVNFKKKMPNTTDLLDSLLYWVPDVEIRRRILADNPAALYGF
jgi:predicted TIM-barrel fold metal-dependent hydrolase